jgi:hypothetical protein
MVRTHPERATTILEDAAYDGAGHAIPLIVTPEPVGYRVEPVEAVLRPGPKGPRSIEKDRVHVTVTNAGWILRIMRVHSKRPGLGVKTMKASITTQPQCTARPLRYRVIVKTAAPGTGYVRRESAIRRVKSAEAIPRCRPKYSVAVDKEMIDDTAAQRSGVGSVVTIARALFCLYVVSEQTGVCVAEPKRIWSVRNDGVNLRIIDTFAWPKLRSLAVDVVQPPVGTQPDFVPSVLVYRGDLS